MIELNSTQTATRNDVDTMSWSHNVPTGLRDSMLVVVIASRTSGDATPSTHTVSYDGVSMTEVRYSTGGDRVFTGIYVLANPNTGNNTISANFTIDGGGNNDAILGASYLLEGVKEVDDNNGASGIATADSLSLTVNDYGAFLIDIHVHRGSTVGNLNSGQTEVYRANNQNETPMHTSYKNNVDPSSDTIGFNSWGNDTYNYGAISLRYQRKPTAKAIII